MEFSIYRRFLENRNYSRSEVYDFLTSSDEEVYKVANYVREKNKGNKVHLRALIEFTNVCKNNCFYCGLRCENKNVNRYRLNETQILESVRNAVGLGYKTIVLQGGEDSFYNVDKLCSIIKKIKEYDVALTLSIGEYDYDEYKVFKTAGADRYLLRIETTDKNLYSELHPNMSFDNRINCLYNLKKLGFEVGTGVIVGLPNQTIDSLVNDILFFKEIDADMVGIGPFIPHPETPLSQFDNNNFDLALKVMATTRLLLPNANIPATTAMETIRKNGRVQALNSGANVVMINMMSEEYKRNYEIYPNKSGIDDSVEKATKDVLFTLKTINRECSYSKGFRLD